MTNTDSDFRSRLEAAAEAAYKREQEEATSLRAFVAAHYGLPLGTGHEDAEAILSGKSARELTKEQLTLVVMHALDLPPGYSLSREQLKVACKHLVAQP